MHEIELSRKMVTIVDDEDYDILSKYKWFANKTNRNVWYALRNRSLVGGLPRSTIYMHREILGVYDSSIIIDHINGDGLLNTKANLRITDKRGNGLNQRAQAGKLYSQYKGVCYRNDTNKFTAHIIEAGVQRSLGCFENEVEAALAYNVAAKDTFGEYARLNQIEGVTFVN